MAGITTCTVNSFKQQLLQGVHCFEAPLTQTGTTTGTNTNNTITALTATANLIVGMAVTGTGIATNTYVAYIINSTAVEISNNASSAGTNSLTFTADQFQFGLIRFTGLAGTYDRTTSNYANVTTNSDEVSGAGYTAGGFALTNVNPSVPDSNTAIVTFSANPSWTSATINTAGGFIYNKGLGATLLPRIGTTGNNAVSFHDFGGAQQVTSGTFTVTLPTANGTAALLRIS